RGVDQELHVVGHNAIEACHLGPNTIASGWHLQKLVAAGSIAKGATYGRSIRVLERDLHARNRGACRIQKRPSDRRGRLRPNNRTRRTNGEKSKQEPAE